MVPRGRRDTVHPSGAIERSRVIENVAGSWRGSDDQTDHDDTALTAASGTGWVDGVTYEHSPKANVETVKFLLELGLDANAANGDGRTSLMVAAAKGRTEVIQMLVEHGAKLDTRDKGSRDTETLVSVIAGHTWQALDYADGLVRFGVQSAVTRPEASGLLRKLMMERGLPVLLRTGLSIPSASSKSVRRECLMIGFCRRFRG
jgi:hypothetical protein